MYTSGYGARFAAALSMLKAGSAMIYRNKKSLIQDKVQSNDVVLDVGFYGQGNPHTSPNWPHKLLKERARDVYGVDLETGDFSGDHYLKENAENFDFPVKFDVIFASDLIEHLSNMGLFLDSCKRNLASNGRLILTTGNTFNLFAIAEKLTKHDPTCNHDHTCYLNEKTLRQLCMKNGFTIVAVDYIYSLELGFRESWKKHILNGLYWFLSKFTDKFIETIAVTTIPLTE
jgi:SAM-dependent methyltransferase